MLRGFIVGVGFIVSPVSLVLVYCWWDYCFGNIIVWAGFIVGSRTLYCFIVGASSLLCRVYFYAEVIFVCRSL